MTLAQDNQAWSHTLPVASATAVAAADAAPTGGMEPEHAPAATPAAVSPPPEPAAEAIPAGRAGPRADGLALGVALMLALTLVQRAVGLGRSILFCRLMSPEELGRWNLVYSFLILAAPLSVLGLYAAFGRYLEYYRQRSQVRTFLRRTVGASLAGVAVVAGAMVLAPETIARLALNDARQAPLIVAAAAVLAAFVACNFCTELLTAWRQVRAVSLLQFANSLAFAVVGVGLLATTSLGPLAVLGGFAAGCLLVTLAATPLLGRCWRSLPAHEPPLAQGEFWSKLLPFAGWVWMTNLLGNLFWAADRYILVHLGAADPTVAAGLVGQYHSSLVLPEVLHAVAAMGATVLLPYLSQDWEAGDRPAVARRMSRVLELAGVGVTLGGAVLLTLAPWLFLVVLGGKYAEGLAVLPGATLCCLWASLFVILQAYLWCAERAAWGTAALGAGLSLNVGLNLLLAPWFGLPGVVAATATANAVSLAFLAGCCFRLGLRPTRGLLATLALPLVVLAPAGVALLLAAGAAGVLAWRRGSEWREPLAQIMARRRRPFESSPRDEPFNL